MSGLKIHKAGPLTLLQDAGRKGFQHLGLAEGGAADAYAFHWANHLLANEKNSACLEITLGPFIAEFQEETLIAFAGANMQYSINDVPLPNWQTHRVSRGDVLQCRDGADGLRAYVAIVGGFQSRKLFGSFSEVARENLAPLQVYNQANLSYTPLNPNSRHITAVPPRYVQEYRDDLRLRVFPGYQFDRFPKDAIHTFCESTYLVSANSDRMGYRLQGNRVAWTHGGIISEGIAFGSVQIPPDGQPIVLLNDRQTIGGYPKIGCVLKEDCWKLAQRRPGQNIRFDLVNTLSV